MFQKPLVTKKLYGSCNLFEISPFVRCSFCHEKYSDQRFWETRVYRLDKNDYQEPIMMGSCDYSICHKDLSLVRFTNKFRFPNQFGFTSRTSMYRIYQQ